METRVRCGAAVRRRREAMVVPLLASSGCEGNVNVFGVYFAPWMACGAGGAVLAYAVTRLLERHLFDYDPRYFAWSFVALTVLFAFAFWSAFVRV